MRSRGSPQLTDARKVGVSVIIPVHDAASTLEATLQSLAGQTYALWEAIIVDDGSTDSTRAMAENWVVKDPRFRILQQEKSGVSTARNHGLREARYSYVLFLDGDDRIAPRHLECMAGKLIANSGLDAVHCGWQRIAPSGVPGRVHYGSPEADLYKYFAWQGYLPIHSCVLKREVALAVGGFDPSLATCEDWDFFQRVSRAGAQFGRVKKALAYYHVRPNSRSQNNRRILSDVFLIMGRGYGSDQRMQTAAEVQEGRFSIPKDIALYYQVAYHAAKEIGAGGDARDFLDAESLQAAPNLSAAALAAAIQEALPIGASRSEAEWFELWNSMNAPLAAFLAKLEFRTRAPGLAFDALQRLRKQAILTNPRRGPVLLENAYLVDIDLTKRICDVPLPPEVDRLICRLTLKGEVTGAVELPGLSVVSGRSIAKAAAEGHARTLIKSALNLRQNVYLSLRTLRGLARRRTLRLVYQVVNAKPGARRDAAKLLAEEVGNMVKANLPWALARRPSLAAQRAGRQWQEQIKNAADAGRAFVRKTFGPRQNCGEWDRFFALPDPWGYDSDYEVTKFEQTLALLPEGVIPDALEIGCAEGHFTVRLAPKVGSLTAVDISPRALKRAEKRCATKSNVTFQILDLGTDKIPGPFHLIVCSEVLYYIKDMQDVLRRIVAQIRPGGFLLTCHSRVAIDDPESIGFDWHHGFGVETIAKTIAIQSDIALRRELRTPLYRILLYQRLAAGQKPLPSEIFESSLLGRMTPLAKEEAKWPGRKPARPALQRTYSVPILMYHRIANDGPPELARYRVAPDLFADQMTTLYEAGYRAIGLADWVGAVAQHRLVPERQVVLTFDDGYRDFLIGAMPVLRTHGFSATVFLVAERIGETAVWDSGYGEAAPLLSWEEVRLLQEVGVEFGCHSSTHRPMTGMRLAELTADIARARAILEEGLGAPVPTLAYPYGAENEFVRRVIAKLGFSAAVTHEPGISRLGDDPLRLRRIEVTGDCSPEQLLSLLTH